MTKYHSKKVNIKMMKRLNYQILNHNQKISRRLQVILGIIITNFHNLKLALKLKNKLGLHIKVNKDLFIAIY